jgi:SAM-dependent methyltransferase
MRSPADTERGAPEDLDFLSVDEFLASMVAAQALRTALALGLIDRLIGAQPSSLDRLQRDWPGDRQGLFCLLELLAANQVVEQLPDQIQLTDSFTRALRYRDLLEAKLDFAQLVAPDLIELFPLLIVEPGRFMQQARVFDLFRYDRCFEPTRENLEATRRWMRLTTCLTRYEARAFIRLHDFTRYQTMLDIGGNSGELILQLCKRHPGLVGTVFDLPLVCRIGREHLEREPEAARIRFIEGNALLDPLPVDFDLVVFKSMLHDWPETEAAALLAKASRSVKPGGTLMIFERGPLELDQAPIPYANIPMLLFFRSFRDPSFYRERLAGLGFEQIEVQFVRLEMPFFLVTGRLPAQARKI